jgi:hypothetical protein
MGIHLRGTCRKNDLETAIDEDSGGCMHDATIVENPYIGNPSDTRKEPK